ncbi:MAG: glycosyltransferase family 39 protein [Candidatus Pacebacteria bacterium]|nr:glycosyltransferase family 39 protein [Candidatus Paceibacterota bacterium]
MKPLSSKFIILAVAAIVAAAFLFRIIGVGSLDMAGDEASYAFRSIGYLDYIGTSFQTQPVEWFNGKQLPFWTKLSFHDQPPLVFAIQNSFFRVFGDSALVARLPSAIFGAASVFLIYILAKMFLGESLALLSAFIFAVNGALVGISRTALLEPILLFFILLNIYLFFKFVGSPKRYWLAWGTSLGLVFLSKYTGVFLIPIYFIYLLIGERAVFKNSKFYLALIVALILFSPVIIYNICLYKAVGHFDLQISYLLGQSTPEWQSLIGKVQNPFSEIGKNLLSLYGVPALIAALLGAIYSAFSFVKIRSPFILFCWLYIVSLVLLLIKIGSAPRFIVLFAPVLIIFSVLLIKFIWGLKGGTKFNYLFKFLAVAFICFEIFFSVKSNFFNINNYGIASLDNSLNEIFKGKQSASVPSSSNSHLNDVIKEFSQKQKGKLYPFIIVYNDNVAMPTLQWIFYRRFFYHSIPTLYVEDFVKMIQGKQVDLRGFDIYFVQSTENTLLNQFKLDKKIGAELEENLKKNTQKPPEIIYGQEGREMFRIYNFSLK